MAFEDDTLEVADVFGELIEVAEFEGEIQGIARGADTNGGVGVFDGLPGQDGYELGDEGLELFSGKAVGFFAEPVQLAAERGVIEPLAEGLFGDAGVAGGLGDGAGDGDDVQDGLLPEGEAGNFKIQGISGSFRYCGNSGVGRLVAGVAPWRVGTRGWLSLIGH